MLGDFTVTAGAEPYKTELRWKGILLGGVHKFSMETRMDTQSVVLTVAEALWKNPAKLGPGAQQLLADNPHWVEIVYSSGDTLST